MPAAIIITLLAVLCTVGVFAVVLVARRPEEGWRAWTGAALRSWRNHEFAWVDTEDTEPEIGGLGALYQLSEPGNGYVIPPDDLPDDLRSGLRAGLESSIWAESVPSGHGRSRRATPPRASHAGS